MGFTTHAVGRLPLLEIFLNHHPASHAMVAAQNLLMCSAPLLARLGLCLKNVRCELACCRMSNELG